jgi:hypothetical protein
LDKKNKLKSGVGSEQIETGKVLTRKTRLENGLTFKSVLALSNLIPFNNLE